MYHDFDEKHQGKECDTYETSGFMSYGTKKWGNPLMWEQFHMYLFYWTNFLEWNGPNAVSVI